MKKVLWVSRHEMTAEQRADLERALGPVELLLYKETVADAAHLRPALEKTDAVAAVLPPELYCDLLKIAGGRPVLRSVAERSPTGRMRTLEDGRTEQEFAFAHRYWEQILRAEFVTRRL